MAGLVALLATLLSLAVTVLMAAETVAIARGRDPLSNGVRALVRRFPVPVYALAVVLGMVLGHLLWP